MSQSPMRRRQTPDKTFDEILACDLYRRWGTVPDHVVRPTGSDEDFDRVCHHDNLLAVARLMRQAGERAAGRDGYRLSDFSVKELAHSCRVVSASLLDASYRRLRVRLKKILKSDGRRHRHIQISQCIDSVVSKALQLYITPIIDGVLLDGCMGYRPSSSLQLACAQLEKQIQVTGNNILVQFDIANMFPSVNRERLQHYLSELFADQRFVELLDRVVRGHADDEGSGLRQGDATSPALTNVYLHHELDIWLSANIGFQLWGRWSDDIWLLASGDIEGCTILRQVEQHLMSRELRLKDPQPNARPVTDLAAGETATLLGVELREENGQPTFSIPDKTFQNLKLKLRACHSHPDPQAYATQVVRSWINAYGHALSRQHGKPAMDHILALCGRTGFHNLSRATVQKWIRAAQEGWECLRTRVQEGGVVRHPRAPRIPVVTTYSDFDPKPGDPGVAPFDVNQRLDIFCQGGFEAHWARLQARRAHRPAGNRVSCSEEARPDDETAELSASFAVPDPGTRSGCEFELQRRWCAR